MLQTASRHVACSSSFINLLCPLLCHNSYQPQHCPPARLQLSLQSNISCPSPLQAGPRRKANVKSTADRVCHPELTAAAADYDDGHGAASADTADVNTASQAKYEEDEEEDEKEREVRSKAAEGYATV